MAGGLKLRLAGALAPRETECFSLLEAAGSNAAHATDKLEERAHFFPDRADVLEELRLAARESDQVTRALTERVNATFVTPIEREDLAALVLVIDELARHSFDVAVLFDVYRIERMRPEARRLTQLVARCGKELTAGLALLRHAGDVAPHTDAIRALVQDGDDVARAGVGELFRPL